MLIVEAIKISVVKTLKSLYEKDFTENDFQINLTKPEFSGDYTVVLFALLKKASKAPAVLGEELGKALLHGFPELFSSMNVIKGFLNLEINNNYWQKFLLDNYNDETFGSQPRHQKKIMVEYSSPNTNKPLHLGHLRNNFLGWSVAEILKATGNTVIKSSIVNDRGIHICKSMLAWQKWGNGETPQSSGLKGDHLVGKYYVLFENELKKQAAELLNTEQQDTQHYDAAQLEKHIALEQIKNQLKDDKDREEKIKKIEDEQNELRRNATPIMKEVKQMLRDWEAGKEEVITLWRTLNNWVYEGMDKTYAAIGSDFDITYYESNTYLLGKDLVNENLEKNIFFKKPDGSVWINLSAEGLDEKLLLRRDGTSVYITQDIGLAVQKYNEYGIDESIYVIGDEQNYHMKVLKAIGKRIGLSYANDIKHLSYGMVELPSGKMKSREGTVVDADDIVAEMEKVAAEKTAALGKVNDFTEAELENLYHVIGLGALKFYLLRVDPKKRMIFNPEESIDFQGFTGPFIQFNYARIKSILRKNKIKEGHIFDANFEPQEKEIIVLLEQFPTVVQKAAQELNPSEIAIYLYQLAKSFSSFYASHSIANAETEDKKQLRLQLATFTANVIKKGMQLLGIQVPERM